MADRILMVAYHFPPCGEVSGTLRTLSMVRGLRSLGWDPIILAPRLASYMSLDNTLASPDEFGDRVFRSFAIDARQHLGVGGRYPEWLAQPDRWASWRLSAVPLGLRLIRRYRPKAIWSTYPIATAHLIAAALNRRSRLPWIADFRDPMLTGTDDIGRMTRASRERLERRVVSKADACVFVTRSAMRAYEERYGVVDHGLFEVIPNGFDEDVVGARLARDRLGYLGATRRVGPLRLLHSGALYANGRSPEPLFRALAALRQRGEISSANLHVVLRGSGPEAVRASYVAMLEHYGIADLVELVPAFERSAALREQLSADGLLLLQGSQFNVQIPAKVYEYLAIGKPIFALTDPAGETARLLESGEGGTVADIGDAAQTEKRLLEFIREVEAGSFVPLAGGELQRHVRSAGAASLVQLLNRVVREP
ncbi:MAG: glycosyltransferase [Acidihalobacter sp.]|uniref:glycosyltransferase n=1 Tax=Acidihalobacter sp. TaxID=1872108 RepID=UPI00307CE169